MSPRLKTFLISAGVLLGCLALALLIAVVGATEERVAQEVRTDHVSELDGGRMLVHVAPEPPPTKVLRVGSITRYPGGWAVIQPAGPGSFERPPARPTLVRTLRLEPGAIPRSVLAFGTIEAERDARVACEVGGRVLAVRVQLGEAVAEGAALAELDPRDADLALARAQAELARAQAGHKRLEAEVAATRDQLVDAQETLLARSRERERAQSLSERGITSSAQLDQAEVAWRAASSDHTRLRGLLQTTQAALTEAQAGVTLSRTAVAIAELARSRCTVRAPFAGRLAERLVEEGDLLAPGAPVARVVSEGSLRVRVHVREQEAIVLRAGARAWLTVPGVPELDLAPGAPGAPGEPWAGLEGQVVGVSAAADPQTRKVALDVRVADPQGLLRDGMFARVRLDAGEVGQSYLVPDVAVTSDEQGNWVYRIDGERVVKVKVELGARQGEGRIVPSAPGPAARALHGSIELATSGLGLLFDGAPIRRLDAGAPLPPGLEGR